MSTITLKNRIANRLQAIRELPIVQLDLRQPMLVEVIADIVDVVTDGGSDTDSCYSVMSQSYYPTLREIAEGAGFKLLGSGYFSVAFKHEMLPGKVIKIGLKKEDSGAAYAAYCRANDGQVGLPKVHALARHKACYSVVLDELTSIEDKLYLQSEDVQAQYRVIQQGIQYPMCADMLEEMGPLTVFQQGLLATSQGIRKFFKGLAFFDVHTGNVMMDRDGNLVITDPVSYSKDIEETATLMDGDNLAVVIERQAIKRACERHQRRHPSTAKRAIDKMRAKHRRAIKRLNSQH